MYVVHYMVYFETQFYSTMLNDLGDYENDFNLITGWPPYFGIMAGYILSIFTTPGQPPEYLHFYRTDLAPCQKCGKRKPTRTYHCTRCNMCVMRRDHHCDFTNSCIGIHNHKSFMIFLLLVPVSTGHFAFRGIHLIYHYYMQDLESM